jgi:hypothetical protein
MTRPFWLRRLFVRKSPAPLRRPARFRPALEALEDRTVPSTFTVSNTNDSGTGSLRQAILDANAAPGADVITFDPTAFSTAQTIRLLSSLPDITDDLTINGPTATRLTISGDANNDGVNDDGDVRILSVSAGDVTLSDLTLTNGRARGADAPSGQTGGNGLGGAINVAGGSLTLNNSSLSNNTAQGGRGGDSTGGSPGGVGLGGAIYVGGGAVTLNNSTLSDNTAQGGNGGNGEGSAGYGGNGWGGAIYVNGGASATLINSTLSGNKAQGGAGGHSISPHGGVQGGNQGSGEGGGLFSDGTVTLTNVTLSGNSAVGALGNGGGLFSDGTLTLTNATVSGNSAGSGGGLFNGDHGTLTLTNVTVSGNTAQGAGGVANGESRLLSGTVTLTNSIVAGNTSGPFSSNISGDYSASHSLVGGDPMLAPLGDYGGPTQTMAPLPGSPAIDAGDSTAPGLPNTDQRGFARISGAAVDIGACEVQAISLSPTTLPDGAYDAAYSQAITATEAGYQGPYTFSLTAGALPAGLSLDGTDGTLSGTPTVAGSFSFTVTATDSLGFTASESYTLTIDSAALTATAANFSATAGAPVSATVATFTTPDQIDGAAAFTAIITWGDGTTSAGVVTGGNGSFSVSGKHTYAAAGSYAVCVQITNPNTQSATANDTAKVTSLNQGVTRGLTGGIGFWHNIQGQTLIDNFNGGPSATALGNWLAASFPNLYGPSTGANSLGGKTNAQVASYFQSLFALGGSQVQAQVLAVGLNVYATTSALGGTAAAAYGFTVSATGLGARSFSVGRDGAAFGVANNTTLTVYQLLLAVNKKAVNGVLYGGNATLQAQCADLLISLDQAGSI